MMTKARSNVNRIILSMILTIVIVNMIIIAIFLKDLTFQIHSNSISQVYVWMCCT